MKTTNMETAISVSRARYVRRTLATGAALALVTWATPRAEAQETRSIDESRSVDRDVSVTVETVNRTVRVTGGDRAELRVRGSYYPEHEEFEIEGDAGSVTVTLKPRQDRHRDRDWNGGLDAGPLTIEVPRGASLEVQGVNGGAAAEGVDGSVSLHSVNGTVEYEGGAGNVEAGTVNGSVRVSAPNGRRVEASSVSGSVTLRSAGGYLSAETVSGDVTIRGDGDFERVQAEALSGDIEFRGRPAGNGTLRFETHSGDVDLYLPADLSARLEAEAFSGEIESDFGGEAAAESRYTPSRSYEHTVGSGGATVTVGAFSGDIRFRRAGD